MRCKPGDLAYVVGPNMPAPWVGRVVRVVDRSAEADSYWGGPSWNVYTSTALPVRSGLGHSRGRGHSATVPDACLRPISGVQVDDELSEEMPA